MSFVGAEQHVDYFSITVTAHYFTLISTYSELFDSTEHLDGL